MEINLFKSKTEPEGRSYQVRPVDSNSTYRVKMFIDRHYPGIKECGLNPEAWLYDAITCLDLKIIGPFLDILLEPDGHFFRPSAILKSSYQLTQEDFQSILEVLNFFGASVANNEPTHDASPLPSKRPLPKGKRKAKA